jgi:hypothetical protein
MISPRQIRFVTRLALAVLALLCAASRSLAQTPSGPHPLEGVCIAVLVREAVPARAEWTWWLSGGGGKDVSDSRSRGRAELGAGSELGFGLLRYRGFPSGAYGRQNGDAELRGGPWAAAGTDFHGPIVEGGVKLHLGAVYHASWGTFDLRLGGGYGVFDDQGSPHVTTTFAYGVRSFLGRYTERGACDPRPVPRAHGYGSVLRPFVTVRRPLETDQLYQLIVGLELTPSFFFPPLSWFRLGGGPP